MSNLKRLTGFLVSAPILLVGIAATSAQASPDSGGEIYVVQGLNGETLDLSIDGDVVAEDSATKEVTGPIEVSAGDHVFEAKQDDGTSVAKAMVEVEEGESLDVIVHLPVDASRDPVVSTFENDLSAIGDGQTRLAVAHTAAVGPADVVVNGKVLFSNIASGETLTQVVPAGSYDVKIVPTTEDGPAVLGPVTLSINAGTLTRVFAIGDVATGNMDAVVQEIAIGNRGGSAPTEIDAGSSGQAVNLMDQSGNGSTGIAIGAGALLAGLAGGVVVRRRRLDSAAA